MKVLILSLSITCVPNGYNISFGLIAYRNYRRDVCVYPFSIAQRKKLLIVPKMNYSVIKKRCFTIYLIALCDQSNLLKALDKNILMDI